MQFGPNFRPFQLVEKLLIQNGSRYVGEFVFIHPQFIAKKKKKKNMNKLTQIRFIFSAWRALRGIPRFKLGFPWRYVPPDPSCAPGEAWKDPASHRGTILQLKTLLFFPRWFRISQPSTVCNDTKYSHYPLVMTKIDVENRHV